MDAFCITGMQVTAKIFPRKKDHLKRQDMSTNFIMIIILLLFTAAFGLIGAIIAATSLHLHVSYKFGVLGESWTRKRVQRATYVVSAILVGCLIGKIVRN